MVDSKRYVIAVMLQPRKFDICVLDTFLQKIMGLYCAYGIIGCDI